MKVKLSGVRVEQSKNEFWYKYKQLTIEKNYLKKVYFRLYLS